MAGSTRLRSLVKRAVGGYKSYVDGGVRKASLSLKEGGGHKSYGRRRGLFVCFFSLRHSAGKNGSLATLVLLLFSFFSCPPSPSFGCQISKEGPFPFLLLQSSQIRNSEQKKQSWSGEEGKNRKGASLPRESSFQLVKRSVISSVGFVNRSVPKLVFGFRSGLSPSLLLLCPSRNPKSGGEKQRKEEKGKKSNVCFVNPCSAVSQVVVFFFQLFRLKSREKLILYLVLILSLGAEGEKIGDCTCWLSKLN